MTNKQHRISTGKTAIFAGVPLFLLASLVVMSMPTAHAGVFDQALSNCDDVSPGMVAFDIQFADDLSVAKCYDPTDSCFANGILALQANPQPCQFGIVITLFGDIAGEPSAILGDAIPAEWEVTGITNVRGSCDFDQANKGKKANRSATILTCDTQTVDAGSTTYPQAAAIVDIQTRESPSTAGKDKDPKFKPTFACEGTPDRNFPVNDGVQAVAIDTDDNVITWDHDDDIETREVPLVLAQTAALSTTAVDEDDLDCDGIPNIDDDVNDRPFTDNGFA